MEFFDWHFYRLKLVFMSYFLTDCGRGLCLGTATCLKTVVVG